MRANITAKANRGRGDARWPTRAQANGSQGPSDEGSTHLEEPIGLVRRRPGNGGTRTMTTGIPSWDSLQALAPPVEVSLLRGLGFACRPECGLCCYANPAVTPGEKTRLLQIDPETPFIETGGDTARLGGRPNGGACHFLRKNRCTVHASRPFPCAEFPVGVHVGLRPQATAILSCPGLDIGAITLWADGRAPETPPLGLDQELLAVASEYARSPVEAWTVQACRDLDRVTRRVEKAGRTVDLEGSRENLRRVPPLLRDLRFASEPPDSTAPLEELPLTFEPEFGRVAFQSTPSGWRLIGLDESGGAARTLGVFSPPVDRPEIVGDADKLLRGYARYLIERDHPLWSILDFLCLHPEVDLERAWRDMVEAALATVVTRASVLQQLKGESGTHLTGEEIRGGIRATDAEVMDRATLGVVL